jgi:hypothetical protein
MSTMSYENTTAILEERDRQAHFQNVSNGILGTPNGYQEVGVLIIRWDESIDQFKGHTEEVSSHAY